MSHQNVEVVRRLYEAYLRDDGESALAAIDPEVEWDSRHHPDGRVYRGHAGVVQFVEDWQGLWEHTSVHPEQFLDAGDRVVVLTRETTKGSGPSITERHAEIYTLRGGKVIHWCAFTDPERALEAAGLRE